MKTLRLIIIICLWVVPFKQCFAQVVTTSGIEYFTPDTVIHKITEVINAEKINTEHFIVWNTRGDLTSLILVDANLKDPQILNLIEGSNRYIKLSNTKKITIVFDSDFQFSTLFHQLKNKGKQNETMLVTDWGLGGYLIEFKGMYGDLKILRSEYFQH